MNAVVDCLLCSDCCTMHWWTPQMPSCSSHGWNGSMPEVTFSSYPCHAPNPWQCHTDSTSSMLLSAVHSSETETTEQYEHLQAPSTYKKHSTWCSCICRAFRRGYVTLGWGLVSENVQGTYWTVMPPSGTHHHSLLITAFHKTLAQQSGAL